MFVRYLAVIGFVLSLCTSIYSGVAQSEQVIIKGEPPASDIFVLNQNGKKLNFYRDLIKGKTVAINFIFTACTSSCPLSAAIFRQVQKKLGKQKVLLITISVDPVNDTPDRLLEFSKRFNAAPGWFFITGEKSTISGLLKSLGTFTADKNEHSNMVIIGNDLNHQWMRLYGFPQAEEILAVLKNVTGASRRQ